MSLLCVYFAVVDIPNSCAAAVSSVLAEADERHAHGGMPAVHPTCTEILPGVDEIKARLMKALEANEGADVIGPLVEQLQRVEDSLHARKTTGLELAVVEPSVEEKLLKLKEEANKLAQLGARRKLGLVCHSIFCANRTSAHRIRVNTMKPLRT